jgi:membrane-bound metal-dependent hydrolase YbcI (DUF457 family)
VSGRDRIIDWFIRPSRSALLSMAVVLFATDQVLLHTRDAAWSAGPLDETAHFLTGALVLAAVGAYMDRSFAVGLLAASVLIDLDHVPGRLGIDWITNGTQRPYTHSLLTVAVGSVAALLWRSRRSLLLGVILALAFHFLRDMSESRASGVPLLWPWSYHSYTSPHWIYVVSMGAVLVAALGTARGKRTLELGGRGARV